MGAPRSKATQEDILGAFHTDEGFKAVAKRLGLSPNTLRVIWKDAFGETAFELRGKTLQARAAANTARAIATTRVYGDVLVPCSACGTEVPHKTNQAAQLDRSTFVCDGCKYDRACPVCGQQVDGERGLVGHFRHRREAGDAAHLEYEKKQGEARWVSLVELEDYVCCSLCGHRAVTLAGHLTASHGISAERYKEQFPGALIRAQRLTEKRSLASKGREGGFGKGARKSILCPSCGTTWEGSKFLAPEMHDPRCPSCKERDLTLLEESRWDGKSEPADYVSCLECSYKAENLTSHLQSAHPGYRDRNPDALVVALSSAVRDKTALVGVPRPAETRQKIRAAKRLDLRREAFLLYLEPDGTVDHRKMLKQIGCCYPTLKRYLDASKLRPTAKYTELGAKKRLVTLTKGALEPFKLKNGKISVAAAVSGLGLCRHTIKRECLHLGVPWAHGNVSQRKCLESVSVALGGVPFTEEWKSWRFVNPLSGHRFRYDGYFETLGLLCEFHGSQHYLFPNLFLPDESYRPVWERMCERDRIKQKLAASSGLQLLTVREDEPYTDLAYLRGRLVSLGVLEVRAQGIWLGDKLVWATPTLVGV